MFTPPLVVPPAPALPPVPPTPPVPGTPAVSPVVTEVPVVPATLVVVVPPPQESITAASATVTPILTTTFAIIRPRTRWLISLPRNHANAIALKSRNAKPEIVTMSCVNGGEDGALSRGSLGGMAPAGKLKTCTVIIDCTLPLMGRKAELGENVHVTPAGAPQKRLNCPAKPPVLATVTAKLALPPRGIIAAVGVTEDVICPTVICMS
jgi:hypothetical protein